MIKKIGLIVGFVLFFLCPTVLQSGGQVFAQVPAFGQEEITAWNEDIKIEQSGSIVVTERLTYNFGNYPKHGIFRTIPLIKTNKNSEKFALSLGSLSVTDESGQPYIFTRSEKNHILTVKIGDPDKTLTGVHTYVIKYSLTGALTYFSDHDELYWNVTGNDWEIPIGIVRVSLSLPENSNSEPRTAACYTGIQGSTAADCRAQAVENLFTFRASQALNSGEGLTIVAGFSKGIVTVAEPTKIVNFSDTIVGKIVGVLIVIFAVGLTFWWYIGYPIWIALKWYRYGRDPKPPMGVTSAWFDAPAIASGRHLRPAETAALVQQGADREDLTATVVDLARRGYFTIAEKNKNDWWFIKKNIPKDDEPLLPYETELYNAFFADGDELRLKDADLVAAGAAVKQQINSQLVADGLYNKDPAQIRVFYTVIGILALVTFNIPLVLSAFIFGLSIPRRTILGAQADAVARSLRNFLASQDKKLAFQADKQMMFEKLLPYAIAFGIETIWVKRFADINLKKPDWYEPYGGGRFNSLLFIASLNSSTKSFMAAATPTTSSSGFSSGFSGGSSGGGGGGGGGGSW